ncbi:MAG: hypothetical protein J6J27_03485 [Alphaproteobacteria bacterium]|nr:hypothetical protein [Alphaproteobacteria bacterium]
MGEKVCKSCVRRKSLKNLYIYSFHYWLRQRWFLMQVCLLQREEKQHRRAGKVCPVGRVIAFKADEDQYYYARKKTCSIPDNAEEQPWDSSSSLKKASWIDAGEAVVFQCEDGYIEKKNACVDGYEICPLNEPLEKADKSSYLNPNTDDACSVPTNATPKKASQEIMEDYGLDSGSAYILGCKEGYYSAQLKGMSDNYIAQCNKCPDGTTSPYGSTSESACVSDGSVVSTSKSESTGIASVSVPAPAPAPAPVPAPAPASVTCRPGTYKANSTTCTPCPAGKYSSSTDATSCSACPTGQWAVAGSKSCTSCLTTGVATCDSKTGKVLSCQTGYNLLNGACSKPAVTAASCVAGQYFNGTSCVSCAAGKYSSAGASSCSACSAGTYSVAGSSTCSACSAGTYSAAGASSCSACSAGTYSVAGSSSCLTCPTGTWSSSNAGSCSNCTNKPANSSYTSNGKANDCSWSCNSGFKKDGNNCALRLWAYKVAVDSGYSFRNGTYRGTTNYQALGEIDIGKKLNNCSSSNILLSNTNIASWKFTWETSRYSDASNTNASFKRNHTSKLGSTYPSSSFFATDCSRIK